EHGRLCGRSSGEENDSQDSGEEDHGEVCDQNGSKENDRQEDRAEVGQTGRRRGITWVKKRIRLASGLAFPARGARSTMPSAKCPQCSRKTRYCAGTCSRALDMRRSPMSPSSASRVRWSSRSTRAVLAS